MLADPHEHVESPLGRHPVPLHEDALGLADDLPRLHGAREGGSLPRGGVGDPGVGGEHQADVLGLVVEGSRAPGEEVQRAEVVALDVQLARHHAECARGHRRDAEARPAVVRGEVGDPDRLMLVGRVQAGSFSQALLERVDHPRQLTRRALGGHPAASEHDADGALVAARDQLDRRAHDLGEGLVRVLLLLDGAGELAELSRELVLPVRGAGVGGGGLSTGLSGHEGNSSAGRRSTTQV